MAASPKHVLTLVDHVGGLPVGNSEAILVILNWTAPSTIRNQVLQGADHICRERGGWPKKQHRRPALLPSFSYKAGNLWLLEMNQLKALATAGIGRGYSVGLVVRQESPRERGARPCTMPGKVMMSQHFCPENVWFKDRLGAGGTHGRGPHDGCEGHDQHRGCGRGSPPVHDRGRSLNQTA